MACTALGVARGDTPVEAAALAKSFATPPPSARPWVYWTWIDGNVNKEGITADLEAMDRVGIGGAIILDVSQSTPHGPVKFLDDQWKEIFKHAISEAKRLGMEININNGPGYYGSGGPWISPEEGMQVVVHSEVRIEGGREWVGQLPLPLERADYRDIAVIAVPERKPPRQLIENLAFKSLAWQGWVAYRGAESAPLDAAVADDAAIALDQVVDLTAKMAPSGSLQWNAPPGNWTVFRFGQAWNGRTVGPSQPAETGPETDKLDKAVTAKHFDAFVTRLNDLVGEQGRHALVGTHIDSWEGGGQNWTAAMRTEFTTRRGYDPVPYLPVLAGRVLGDLQISERFLFDLRKTVSELMIENYSAEFHRLARKAGLRLTYESYTTIGHDLDNAMHADEPMAEFWTPNGQGSDFYPTIKSMSSAAHLQGLSTVGAEAFTSGDREKFLWHPAMIKSFGDDAFCGGVNRLVFHRYAAQPFADGVQPGMQMGPWGLHYERTNTWWDFSKPWHEYLARCQFMLRQGAFVADVLRLESEEPLRRFQLSPLRGYDYDACGPATFLRAVVRDGRVEFPSGATYRLIVLTDKPTMSVELLRRLRDMVSAGAAILGEPPQRTPGLSGYPQADVELGKLAQEIWGDDPTVHDRHVGKGRVFRRIPAEQALAALGVPPDFASDSGVKYIHRKLNDADLYFLSSPAGVAGMTRCTFRVEGRQAALWNPLTGETTPLRAYSAANAGETTISIPFEPSGSAFVVFAGEAVPSKHIVNVTWNDIPILEGGLYLPLQPGTPAPFDVISGALNERGAFVVTTANGEQRRLDSRESSRQVSVKGPWKVDFAKGWGAPESATFDDLISWSQHADLGIRYFSGTAMYTSTFQVDGVRRRERACLDLGRVAVAARVRLNGQDVGIAWKPPYRLDVTGALRSGDNVLEIEVSNLWVNRLIGDEQLAEDSDRNPNGTLKSWPPWLIHGERSPAGRFTFSSWRLWGRNDALQESGLLGPVIVQRVRHHDF